MQKEKQGKIENTENENDKEKMKKNEKGRISYEGDREIVGRKIKRDGDKGKTMVVNSKKNETEGEGEVGEGHKEKKERSKEELVTKELEMLLERR